MAMKFHRELVESAKADFLDLFGSESGLEIRCALLMDVEAHEARCSCGREPISAR
jgi:hypothetical protein